MGGDSLDPMVAAMVEEGEQAIGALPTHASRIAGLLAQHFPAQTLEAVHAQMRPGVEASKKGVNQQVRALSPLLSLRLLSSLSCPIASLLRLASLVRRASTNRRERLSFLSPR